jgi:hypothetical protein
MSGDAPPRNWKEFIPFFVWGGLVFTCAVVFIEKLVEQSFGQAIAALLLGLGIAAVAIHSKTWLDKTNPNWAFAVAALLLAAIILSPFVEEQRWPLSAWFRSVAPPIVVHGSPSAEDIAKATSVIQDKLDEAIKQRDQYFSDDTEIRNQLGTAKRDLDVLRATIPQSSLDSALMGSQTHEASGECALMSNEVLKRHAYELAQEIEDL